jgi:putative endonuclease
MHLFDDERYATLPRQRRAALPARIETTYVTGLCGEQIVADRLEERGWTLLGRRVRTNWGEIDIIARRGATVAFCEVKTTGGPARNLLYQVDRLQCHRLRRAAVAWMAAAPSLHRGASRYRFDVFLVRIGADDDIDVDQISDAF